MDFKLPGIADRAWLRHSLRGLLAFQGLVAVALGAWLHARGWSPIASAASAAGAIVAASWGLAAGGFLVKWLLGDWPAATRGARWPRTLWVESLWMLRLFVVDMPWRASPAHAQGDSRRPPLLLVHGFLCNGAVWRPFAGALRASGWNHAAVSLEPTYHDFQRQLDALDAAVQALIATSGQPRVVLVGHSMGGLLIRAYARRAPQRCAALLMVAAPHHGTALGDLVHGVEYGPPSPRCSWLQALNREDDEHSALPALNLWSGDDNIVLPARSSQLRRTPELALHGHGHMALIAAPAACRALVRALDDFLPALEQAA